MAPASPTCCGAPTSRCTPPRTPTPGSAVYDPELDHLNRLRFEMIQDLDAALNQRQFVLHYQPKIDVASGATFGAEALVRWEHPTRGLLYPDAFLPVVEQNGLMNAVTWFVLQEAVRQLVIWKEDGLDISIAVNLSASDLLDDSLADRIEALLDEHSLPAGALELEITESVIMLDPERARTVLEALRRLGLRIAIDDYGTGYCALAYLRDLPVDELKLDRSFAARVSHGCAQRRDRPLDDRARPRPRPAGRRRRRRGPADPRRRRRASAAITRRAYYFSRPVPAAAFAAAVHLAEFEPGAQAFPLAS